ncbi:MAG: hypothetical protein K9J13_17245 [Saprospiraceae bacterium]|nr:hypothetical protein [Saprospiraceae bacterium]
MKKLTFLLAFMLLAAISTKATIWTVSNNPVDSSAADYSNLQTAINNASAGDTIYVSGSIISYPAVYIKKKLIIIGAGYHSANSKHFSTMISSITLGYELDVYNNVISSANNSAVIGIMGTINGDVGIDNIVLKRNKGNIHMSGSTSNLSSNWIIINCIVTTINANIGVSNIFFANNINLGTAQFNSSTIKNNLFIGSSATGDNNIFKNNIIYFGSTLNNFTNSTIQNNLSFAGATTITTTFSYSTTNTISGNKENQDPKFVDVTVSLTTFDYANDYHLQSSSPAKNAGTDNTDIGIYGGAYPFPSGGSSPYQTSAMPDIPQIMDLQISNPIIPIDSVLHINVKARIHD